MNVCMKYEGAMTTVEAFSISVVYWKDFVIKESGDILGRS